MAKIWDDLKSNVKVWSSVAVEKAEEVSKVAVAKTEELTKLSKIKLDIHNTQREFKKETYQKSDTLALEQMEWINIDVENQIKGSVMPMIWKKNYGKGRIFYSSIGHNLYDFDTPELMTMQMRGFRWASEGKYANKEPTITPVYKK